MRTCIRRKTIAVLLSICLLLGLLSGCAMFAEYTVRFDGDEIPAQTVRSGQKVTPVDDPVREGYVFAGW